LPNGAQIHFNDVFFHKKSDGDAFSMADLPSETVLQEPYSAWPRKNADLAIPIMYGDASSALTEKKITFGLDIVAATFFMATRWEEATKPNRDAYGRFPGKASWAHRTDNLTTPLVHRYAELLWSSLVAMGWPSQQRTPRRSRIVLSCDVDHPRLWWEPWEGLRTLGGAFKRGTPVQELTYWAKHWLHQRKDPFDTFDELTAFAEGSTVQFNFLGKRPRHFDCWYDIDHPSIRKTMEQLADAGHTIGFHPSREAHGDRERFGMELDSVRHVSPVAVDTGRHHYLLFNAPDTWQLWEDFGMTEDSTVGYRDLAGYRTGMAIDFPVFNFKTRKMLRLRERPLTIMDITFAEHSYSELGEARTAHYRKIIDGAVRFDGQLSLLWHNSSILTPKWAPEWEEALKMKAYFPC
jgi:hypothetical protein